ncbi:MAG: hypothetical protein Q8P91_01675 [bacterium]|nr:hypothetical protein [bacterium]
MPFTQSDKTYIKDAFSVALNKQELKFENKLDGIELKFENKLDGIELKFENKLDGIELKFENKLDEIELKFEGKLTEFKSEFFEKIDPILKEVVTAREERPLIVRKYPTPGVGFECPNSCQT